MGANFKWETLGDIAAKGWELGIVCGCGKRATLSARWVFERFVAAGWDMRKHRICERLRCSNCGDRPERVGISADKPQPFTQGPLTLAGMRAQGVRGVSVDCTCRGPHDLNVDHLPASLPVPAVRFRVTCPGCGARPMRTMPNWIERGPMVGRGR